MKPLITKNLFIMVLISLTVHVLGMSIISIVTPQGRDRLKTYTRVDFLGAVFQKTAFDIMLEGTDAFYKGNVSNLIIQPQDLEYLQAPVQKQKSIINEVPINLKNQMDGVVKIFLKGNKIIPNIFSNDEVLQSANHDILSKKNIRTIVYSSEKTLIKHGLYGDKKDFKVKFKALLGKDGDIKTTELITTTGYPQLDMTAAKLLRESIFKSSENIMATNEWCEIEVILKTGN